MDIANDNSYKYVWGGWGKASGGYDCRHFVIDAYIKAGINLKGAGATYTGDMARALMKCGFKDVKGQVNLSTAAGLIKGDVLLNSAKHAALVQRDGGTTVEAWCTKGGIVANQTRTGETGLSWDAYASSEAKRNDQRQLGAPHSPHSENCAVFFIY